MASFADFRSRFARWVTLTAALLQFVGGVVGPLAHRHLVAASAVATADTGEPDRSGGVADHGELACLVCQVLNTVAVFPTGVAPPAASWAALPAPPGTALSHPLPHSASARARAPPLA